MSVTNNKTDLNGESENRFHAKMARTMAQPKKNTVTNVIKVCVTMEMLPDAPPPPSPTPPRSPVRSETLTTFLALISLVAFPLAFRLSSAFGAVPPPLEIDMALFSAEPSSTSECDFDSDLESTEATAARTRKHPAAAVLWRRHMMI